MQATLTTPKPSTGGPSTKTRSTFRGVYETKITGRYTPMSVHQLAIAWWLYRSDHITRQQFRIYFAAQEMKERRRYTKVDPDDPRKKPRKPTYTLDEIKDLIGSKGSDTADKALSADVKKLGRLGLVKISDRAITFATSIEQITPPETDQELPGVGGFWDFFSQLPNTKRTVPMPRRTTRALAKGMSRGVSGVMLALVIRSLYWHRPRNSAASQGEQGGAGSGGGRYRIDGRTKCSWVAEVFNLDRKTVSNARRHLIDCGWLVPIECNQWELNKWGQRYTLNVHAFGPPPPEAPEVATAPEEAAVEDTQAKASEESFEISGGGFPSPSGELSGVFPSPCLNTSSSPIGEDLKTRKPDHARSGCRSVGSRKKKLGSVPPPRITNFRGEDFGDTGRMVELHRQAIEAGYPVKGEKGRLEFFALAERARRHGNDAPRLFAWLLRERRFDFITHAEEDAAIARLRRFRDQENRPRSNPAAVGGLAPGIPGTPGRGGRGRRSSRNTAQDFRAGLGADERFVQACIITGRDHRIDPFRIAQAQGWTRERWDEAKMVYEHAEKKRWVVDQSEGGGFMHFMDDIGEG